ncbi:MAG TPA: alkene reductase, partial [Alphaproteobacteria bacterium]|nr:alkene reductase [Alphaproteobacteria bacterium]
WKQADYETPHALTLAEISAIRDDFRSAAENAKQAGFDGVEVHGANGYLLDQFLQDGSNQRSDAYGGSIENRARLLLEVVDDVIAIWGHGRTGVRLSPYGTFNDMQDSDPVALFTHVLNKLNRRQIAYAHVIEPRATNAGGQDGSVETAPSAAALFRVLFNGAYISAGGYVPETAEATIAQGDADAIAFGRYYISNPDLVARIRQGAALARYQRATFYGGNEKGYTDYPAYSADAT